MASRSSEGEPWRGAGERVAPPRGRLSPPDLDTHSRHQTFYFDARGCCAATTTSPRSSADGRRAAHYCADHVAGRRARLPDPPLGPPDRPGQPLAAVPDPGLARARPTLQVQRAGSVYGVAVEAGPLAHRDLALQREGALGARLQGGRARAPGADPRRAHGRRAVADAGPQQDVPAAPARRRGDRRLDGDHRCARAPLSRTRRSIPRIPTSAAGRWSSRSSSTRSWVPTPACSPSTRRRRTRRSSSASRSTCCLAAWPTLGRSARGRCASSQRSRPFATG